MPCKSRAVTMHTELTVLTQVELSLTCILIKGFFLSSGDDYIMVHEKSRTYIKMCER